MQSIDFSFIKGPGPLNEMPSNVLKDFTGLVTISWSEELEAVCLKWHTEFDKGDRVIETVEFALSYVNEHEIRHWWVDLSTSREGLKASDQNWVQTAFGEAIASSSLEKLAMAPPLPETGQDTGWLDAWELNTNARYRGKIEARLVFSESEVRKHFGK